MPFSPRPCAGTHGVSLPGAEANHSPISVALDPTTLDLEDLVGYCAEEAQEYQRTQSGSTVCCYELFRRALVEKNELAWMYLFEQYAPLVERWVRRSPAFERSEETSDYFIGAAFLKFWHAVTPQRFASFPTLAALLHYLHMCTSSVVIDSVRAQPPQRADMMVEEVTASEEQPDETAIQQVTQEEIWRVIGGQVRGEQERLVLVGSFVLGLTPRAIYAQHGDRFTSISDVYNVKRNLLGRLGRNEEVRNLLVP